MSLCGSWGYALAFSLEGRMLQGVNIFHLLGVSALQERSTILFCVSLGAKPGSQAWLCSSLLAASLCLCGPSRPSLAPVSTCSGTSGKAMKAEWNLCPTNKKQRAQKGTHAQESLRVLLSLSYWILSFDQQNADLKVFDWGLHIMTHYM